MIKGRDGKARSSLKMNALNIALTVLSLLFALFVAEAALQLYAALDAGDATQMVRSERDATTAAPVGNRATSRYAASLAIGTSVDPRLYERSPPILQESRSINPVDKARFKAYVDVNKFAPQSYYIWNDEYVKNAACDERNEQFGICRSTSEPFPRSTVTRIRSTDFA